MCLEMHTYNIFLKEKSYFYKRIGISLRKKGSTVIGKGPISLEVASSVVDF